MHITKSIIRNIKRIIIIILLILRAQLFIRLFQVFSKDITFSFNFSDYTIHKSEFLLTLLYVMPTGLDSVRQCGRD